MIAPSPLLSHGFDESSSEEEDRVPKERKRKPIAPPTHSIRDIVAHAREMAIPSDEDEMPSPPSVSNTSQDAYFKRVGPAERVELSISGSGFITPTGHISKVAVSFHFGSSSKKAFLVSAFFFLRIVSKLHILLLKKHTWSCFHNVCSSLFFVFSYC